ncbi:hypothetical protein CRE_30471 [Caenorhabditis remanei]|uniref:Uncharacterized protein n=1 Tax=Caenorhabditis remanei TaxID=31234 RepID=E3NDZ7_CAERE|nr:hypothetical protein CRE_30471 [Caenorhabditis remanei]
MAEQNRPNTNVTDFERADRINGLEEYQALLDYVEDIAMAVIQVGEHPASEAARQLVDIFFDELFNMMQIFIELFN